MSDEQFNMAMERLKDRDRAALHAIYEDYVGFVYHVIYDIVRQKEAAEDITSEFFIRLYEKAGQYKPGSGHKGYLATIARNMAIDYLRKYQKEQFIEPSNDEDGDASLEIEDDKTPKPEDAVIGDLSVKEALDKLKPVYRQIVTMKVLGDMTFKEIAEVLKIPIGTVTWNYQDAMKKLRNFGYE